MFGKQDLVDEMMLECEVAKYLFTKLPREDRAAALAYRPTPAQRSTLELLRYLSYAAIGSCLACVEGNWDGWQRVSQRAESMEADDFPAAMDRQQSEIAALLGGLSDEDLSSRKAKTPLGQEVKLGHGLLEMPLRWLTGYRMQLFLYARSLGADIGTTDCWYGMPSKS